MKLWLFTNMVNVVILLKLIIPGKGKFSPMTSKVVGEWEVFALAPFL